MGTSEQKKFMKQFKDYQEDQGIELGAPTFAKKVVDPFKLWVAVQEMGGHAEVMATKGWARVGRLFEPPKSMTDLSFRIRKLYETYVLPFEKAVLKGEVEGDVYLPPRLELPAASSKPKGTRSRANKRSSAPLPPRNHPKRARKATAAMETGDALVGRRVSVLWEDERQYYSGTVAAYDEVLDRHKVEYDDGDEEMEDLASMTWHPLPGPNDPPLEDDSGAAQDDDGDERISSDDERGEGGAEEDGEEEEDPSDACCVCQGPSYKVYQSDDKSEFEIFCLAPGLQVEDISVKCWDNGKLLVVKNPKKTEGNQKWGLAPSKDKILLPRPVVASTARAVVTQNSRLNACAAAVVEGQGGGAAAEPGAAEAVATAKQQGEGAETAAGGAETQEHQHSTSPEPRQLEGAPQKGDIPRVEAAAAEAPPPKMERSSSRI